MADLPGWTLGGSSIEKMMSASGLDCLKKQGVFQSRVRLRGRSEFGFHKPSRIFDLPAVRSE